MALNTITQHNPKWLGITQTMIFLFGDFELFPLVRTVITECLMCVASSDQIGVVAIHSCMFSHENNNNENN